MVFTPPKRQIPNDWLDKNGLFVFEKLKPWYDEHCNQKISSPDFCTIYILTHIISWKPQCWRNGYLDTPGSAKKSESLEIERINWLQPYMSNANIRTLYELVAHVRLRGVSLRAQRALLNWYTGDYELQASFSIPSPRTLLRLQSKGLRIISFFSRPEELKRKHLGRDPLTFSLHDLEHADEFFYDRDTHLQQKKFYKKLLERLESGEFSKALLDPNFESEFEYLISDMNSHPAHLEATLDHLCIKYQ